MSFLGLLNFLKIHSLSLLCVSGTHGAWPVHCTAMISHSANIKFHTHMCIYTDQSHLTPPSTLQPATHLPDIPTPVPQGCYVHTWNGCVGLCPSPLFGCCCMHPCCSMVVKHALSPAEQAHTSSCALIISLDDFHCPAIGFQVAITLFIKLYQFFDFSHMHVPILVTTTHPGLPSPP